MCNDYEQHIRWAEYRRMMQALELGIPAQQSELDLPVSDDVRINDRGAVMRAAHNGVELVSMSFGFPPSSRGGPVFNFRSEGRHFDKSNRCLIPASAFFEFTGKKYPKAKHRFSLKGAPFMAIAGLSREGKGNQPASFTMLTTEPTRMSAISQSAGGRSSARRLNRMDSSNETRGPALAAFPAGSLNVETVLAGLDG
jgi:putative SOS response-associated peptidase YedK